MSYQVSPQGTYDSLTHDTAELLFADMEALQATGDRSEHLLETFEAWCRETGYEDSALILATVFTTKVLLSLARYYRTS